LIHKIPDLIPEHEVAIWCELTDGPGLLINHPAIGNRSIPIERFHLQALAKDILNKYGPYEWRASPPENE